MGELDFFIQRNEEVNDTLNEFVQLVKQYKFKTNRARVNLASSEDEVERKWKRPWLKRGVLSCSVRNGRLLELANQMLGESINRLQLNRQLACPPHRDIRNKGPSWVLAFGDFEGGELVLEDGTVYGEKMKWQGPLNGYEVTHFNNPIIAGDNWSVIAYSG